MKKYFAAKVSRNTGIVGNDKNSQVSCTLATSGWSDRCTHIYNLGISYKWYGFGVESLQYEGSTAL